MGIVKIEVAINVTRKRGLNCDPFKNYSCNLNKYICSRKYLVSDKNIIIFGPENSG